MMKLDTLTKLVASKAAWLGLMACTIACGDANMDPLHYAGDGLLENSQPNAIALRASDLMNSPEAVFDFSGYELDGNSLVLLVGNRPMSCAAPRDAVGCPRNAGWQSAVVVPEGADLAQPIAIHNALSWTHYCRVAGATGCSESGVEGRILNPGATLSLTIDAGSISVELAGTDEFAGSSTDGQGNVSEYSFTADGTYPVVRCNAAPQLTSE